MNTTYGQTKLRWLDEGELKKLFSLSGQYRLMFETMYFYGLRRGEVGLLKKSDVEKDTVWITRLKRRGNFRHALPLVGKLQKKLPRIETEYLFPGYGGGISGSAVAKAWALIVHKSGLYRYQEPPSVHCLRHSCAMNLFSLKRRPSDECQVWLGHSSLNSTMIYYKIEATRLKSIADEMAGVL